MGPLRALLVRFEVKGDAPSALLPLWGVERRLKGHQWLFPKFCSASQLPLMLYNRSVGEFRCLQSFS